MSGEIDLIDDIDIFNRAKKQMAKIDDKMLLGCCEAQRYLMFRCSVIRRRLLMNLRIVCIPNTTATRYGSRTLAGVHRTD